MAGGPRIRKSHTDIIVAQYKRLRSTRAVAERTGFSRSKVQRHLRLAGVEMLPAGRPVSRSR